MGRASLVLVLGLGVLACRAEATQLIVVVDSDIADVQAVRIEVEGDDGRMQMNRFDIGLAPRTQLPFSFGVAPREGSPAESQTPRIRAFAVGVGPGGEDVDLVERRVQVGFVKSKTLHLLMYLAEACRGARTTECEGMGLVCDRGECVEEMINPSLLPEVKPNDAIRFDGGARLDASFDVAAPPLAAPRILYPWNGVAVRALQITWTPTDGSSSTNIEYGTSCEELPGCVPSGATAIETSTGSTFDFGETNGRWYFRLQACRGADGTDCGDWSETRYFDVGRTDADTDGDGFDDIVAGAPGYGDLDWGKVWWFASSSATPSVLRDTSEVGERMAFVGDFDGDGAGDLAIAGTARFDLYLGMRGGAPRLSALGAPLSPLADVAGLGDIDGDGFPDLAICNGSSIRIFFGPAIGPDPVLYDEPVRRVAGLGDLDGDGLVEIAATQDETVVIYRGSRTRELIALAMLTAPTPDRDFGDRVVSVGDRDDDGIADFVIGAPDFDPTDGDGAGAAYFVSGAAVASGTPTLEMLDLAPAPGQHLGAAIASLDDGYAIAGPGGADPDIEGRIVYVVHTAGVTMSEIAEPIAGDRLGTSLSSGDVNGDATLELISGAPFGGDRSEGALVLFMGNPPMQVPDRQSIPDADGGTMRTSPRFGTGLAQAPPSRLR